MGVGGTQAERARGVGCKERPSESVTHSTLTCGDKSNVKLTVGGSDKAPSYNREIEREAFTDVFVK